MNAGDDGSLLVVDGATVAALLAGREHTIVDVIRAAYLAHDRGEASLPHSVFLRFPQAPANRIIALPAYLGGTWDVAGLKWIASFPHNIDAGLDRASAVLLLSSADTGHPFAVVEGSLISAQRTAASAALATKLFWQRRSGAHMAVIGCGVIAYEIVRFVHETVAPPARLKAYDRSPERADAFVARYAADFGKLDAEVVDTHEEAIRGADLVAFATTAATAHVHERSLFAPGATVLHVSLRDLAPELILAFDNVVDDPDHVCRAETSVHLAERSSGARDFIRATLADVISGRRAPRESTSDVVVFSPFGLGVLDLAVGHVVVDAAREHDRGVLIRSFLPASWRRPIDATIPQNG